MDAIRTKPGRERLSNYFLIPMLIKTEIEAVATTSALRRFVQEIRDSLCRTESSNKKVNICSSIGGLLACSTNIGLKLENQDRFRCDDVGSCKILVLADGVTKSDHGGQAAEIAADTFYEVIKSACDSQGVMGVKVFQEAYQKTIERLKKVAQSETPENEKTYETTVIAIVEVEDRFHITYLGDGKIYLVRGDMERGIQLMITHTVGPSLGGALGPYDLLSEPVYVEHSKSFKSGEIIVAGTDGAFDWEAGEGNQPIVQILEILKNKDALCKQETLQQALDLFLRNLGDCKCLGDNATLGVILTEKARDALVTKEQDL